VKRVAQPGAAQRLNPLYCVQLWVDGEALERIAKESEVLLSPGSVSPDRLIGNRCKFVGREVGSIGHGSEVGHEWCVDISDRLPVDSVEEGMLADLFNSETLIL